MMFATLAVPLRTMIFAMGGAVLAWIWYGVNPMLAIALVAIVMTAVAVMQRYACDCVTTRPLRALKLMEMRLIGIGAASAAAAAIVIVLAIELTPSTDADPVFKQVVGAATAALGAFITGVTVAGEDTDKKIADYVQEQFQSRFAAEGEELKSGQRALKPGKGLDAVFTSYEYMWTDWSKPKRWARVTALAKELDGDSVA